MENFYILRQGYTNSGKFLKNIYINDGNNQTLEPLSTIIRICLLKFKSRGCKISVSNNRIYLQSSNIFQGAKRWMWGDTRNDIIYLCTAIKNLLDYYDPNTNENIKNIFKYGVDGLKNLKKSYATEKEGNLVSNSIELYIKSINDKLLSNDEKENKNSCPVDKLKVVWNKNEIKVVSELLDITNEKYIKNEDYHGYINAIEDILNEKDNLINTIIKFPSN